MNGPLNQNSHQNIPSSCPSLPTGLDDDLGDPVTRQNAAQIIADSILPDYVKVLG